MNEQGNIPGTPKENLKVLRILCIALVTGVILFAVLAITINLVDRPIGLEFEKYNTILIWMAAILAATCLLVATFQYNRGMAFVKNTTNVLIGKLNQYRTVLVRYMAWCEGAALFSVIAYFLTGVFFILGITAIMLIAMLVKAPLRKKVIVDELQLDWNEQQEFE